jgi:hypothetical protein
MIMAMPVFLFDNKPRNCPFGHELWPGKARVSWKPGFPGLERVGHEGQADGSRFGTLSSVAAWRYG